MKWEAKPCFRKWKWRQNKARFQKTLIKSLDLIYKQWETRRRRRSQFPQGSKWHLHTCPVSFAFSLLTSFPLTLHTYLCLSNSGCLSLPWAHQAHSCLRIPPRAVPSLWNVLPPDLCMMGSLLSFKSQLKCLLLREAFPTTQCKTAIQSLYYTPHSFFRGTHCY